MSTSFWSVLAGTGPVGKMLSTGSCHGNVAARRAVCSASQGVIHAASDTQYLYSLMLCTDYSVRMTGMYDDHAIAVCVSSCDSCMVQARKLIPASAMYGCWCNPGRVTIVGCSQLN